MGRKKHIKKENRARESLRSDPLPLIQNTCVSGNTMLDTAEKAAWFMLDEILAKEIKPDGRMLQALIQLMQWLEEYGRAEERKPYLTCTPHYFLRKYMWLLAGDGQVVFLPSALFPVPKDFTLDDTGELLNMASILWTEYIKATQKPPTIKTFLCDFLYCVMVGDVQIGERTPSHLHVLSIKDISFSKRMITRILGSTECVVCLEVSQTRPLRCRQCANAVCKECFSGRRITTCPVCQGHDMLRKVEHIATLPISGQHVAE